MSKARLYANGTVRAVAATVSFAGAGYVVWQGHKLRTLSHNAVHKGHHSVQETEQSLQYFMNGEAISAKCLTPAVQNATTTAAITQAQTDYHKCVAEELPSGISSVTMILPIILAFQLGFPFLRKSRAYFHAAKHYSNEPQRFTLIDPAENAHALAADASATASDFTITNGIGAHATIMVPPDAKIYGERGSLLAQNAHITMESTAGAKKGAKTFLGRLFSGEGAFMMRYHNTSYQPQELVLKPTGGQQIAQIDLGREGTIMCQNGAFFAANEWVNISLKQIGNASFSHFSGEGLTMQKIQIADRAAKILITSQGTIIKRDLKEGETLQLQKRALLAAGPGITLGLQEVKGTFTRMASGEGAFLTTVTGPGTVWLTTAEHADKSSGAIMSLLRRITPG